MKDRVPLYPGRVKLTPVSGQENVYDMVRADQPTQEGDPLNKSTFLTDSTASFFGMDSAAVPNDIFNILKNVSLIDNSEETYKATDVLGNIIGGFTNIQTGSYVGTGTYGSRNPTTISLFPGAKLLFLTRPKYSYEAGYTVSTIHLWDLTSTYTPIAYISPATARYNLEYSSNQVQNTGVMAKMDSGVLSIYNTTKAASQLNESGATYYWMAIG